MANVSKMSVMVDLFPNSESESQIMAWGGIEDLVAVRPSVIKILNNINYAKYVRARLPECITIVRYMPAEEAFEGQVVLGETNPDTMVSIWLKTFLPFIKAAGKGVYWEVAFNEPGPDKLRALNAFYTRLQIACKDYQVKNGWKGIPLVIGNFSAEFNLYDKVADFTEALEECLKNKNILGLHGYESPDLRNELDSPFLFPHRKLYEVLGKKMPAVVYTEIGIDVIFSEHKVYPGWKTTGATPEQYEAQLEAVDTELNRGTTADNRVAGACIFVYSRNTGDSDKTMYNIAFGEEAKPKQGKPAVPAVWELLQPYLAQRPGPAFTFPAVTTPDPNPVPEPTGKVAVKLASFCNQRANPSLGAIQLGRMEAGAYQVVEYPATNGYVKVVGQDYWLLAANLVPIIS